MIQQPERPVILASASPRRRDLLTQLGLIFEILPAHIDESQRPGESPLEYVCRLSEEKGQAVAHLHHDKIMIASDTIVLFEDEILGKPENRDDAFRMLRLLSGNTHEVITAFSIICVDLNVNVTEYEVTDVHFRDLSDQEILDYISGGSPMDKAGAYGIQDLEVYLVDAIKGSYHNVIGFPIAHFAQTWNKFVTGNK